MANPTTYFGWVMPNSADLVTDLPADFNVFGQGVDTSMQFLLGGTTGQVLSKTSATNMAFTWINNDTGDITGVTAGTGISGGGTSGTVTVTNDMATTITTAGDLIKGTGSGTYNRLGIGSTSQVLTVVSGAPAWATPAATEPITFWARPASVQTFTASTATKVTLGTEVLDSDGLFASSRFTPNKAGYYVIMSNLCVTGSVMTGLNISILYKNGAQEQAVNRFNTTAAIITSASNMIYLNGTTDYVELYIYSTFTSPQIEVADSQGFQGFFIHS